MSPVPAADPVVVRAIVVHLAKVSLRSQDGGVASHLGWVNRLFAVERGGSLMQGLVALRWDGCCEASNRTRTTSCDRAYVLAA